MPRSTRNKVRFQIGKASDEIDRCLEHLAYASELAEERSTPINNYMPQLVVLLTGVQKLLIQFRGEL